MLSKDEYSRIINDPEFIKEQLKFEVHFNIREVANLFED